MNDPTATLFAPVPRYLLESDSEDESEITSGAGPSRPKIQVQAQPYFIRGLDDRSFDQVIIGVGQAGRYLSRKLGPSSSSIKVERGDEVVGEGSVMEGVLSLSVKELDHPHIWDLAKALRHTIKASTWIIVTTYLPAMYIPHPRSTLPKTPPIRYISTQPVNLPDSVAKLESPNFASGLPAALASLAIHPSSSGPPTTIVSLPLPLSELPSASFTKALTALLPGIGRFISAREGDRTARWDENDDEPFEAPGMGAGKRSKTTPLTKEDVGSMYM